MLTVYVLYSPAHNKIYIGFTLNLETRMLSHNVFATKGYATKFHPWEIIHCEVFETKGEAMKIEKEMKSANGFCKKLTLKIHDVLYLKPNALKI